jgi:putative ABC transport system permease protein
MTGFTISRPISRNRKAFDATASVIVIMLYREYALLVGVALVIAAPLTVLVMHRWLSQFAEFVGVEWACWRSLALGLWGSC